MALTLYHAAEGVASAMLLAPLLPCSEEVWHGKAASVPIPEVEQVLERTRLIIAQATAGPTVQASQDDHAS